MKSVFTLFMVLIAFALLPTQSIAQPDNDLPCDAIVIVVDDPAITIDNTGATVSAGELAPPPGQPGNSCVTSWCGDENEVQNSVWFTFVAPSNGAVIINTCTDTTAIDTQIALWTTSDCGDFAQFSFIVANDDLPNGCNTGNEYSSNIQIDGLTAGAIYYIQVDGYDAEEGEFGIEVLTGVASSMVNFIHNSADTGVATVDIRVNGVLYADDIAYQTCTGYISVPADISSVITINPSDSEDDTTPLYTITTSFNSTMDYLATVTGIYSATGYTPVQPLEIALYEGAQIFSQTPGVVPVIFFHGSTDSPTLDIVNGETTTVIDNNLAYGSYSANGYIDSESNAYSIVLTDEDGNDLGFNYCIPVGMAAQFGAAFTFALSGFSTPSNNSDGTPLGVYVVNHFNGEFLLLEPGLCAFPSNDDLCSPLNLIVNDPPVTVDNSLASIQVGESSPDNLPSDDPESDCINSWCDGVIDNTLWFTFIAPASGSVSVSTCFAETIDTQISICTVADCNNFSSVDYIVSNDDMEGGCEAGDEFASYIEIDGLTPGTTYYIQADGWEGETGSFQIQVLELTVGLSTTAEQRYAIFPNPAKNQIRIDGIKTNTIVELRDIHGNSVFQGILRNNTLPVSNYAPGVYTVLIHGTEGTVARKLIIE